MFIYFLLADQKIHHSILVIKFYTQAKDKDFELELSWICDESDKKFEAVPRDLFDAAESQAKASLESDEDMDED